MSTDTLRYKAKERYQFGWADPKEQNWATRFEDLKTTVIGHFARSMTNDQLKAAWILEYGDRPITFHELKEKWIQDESGDARCIAQETHYRELLIAEKDFSSNFTIYAIKDKLNASN
jgi:hypothetical protein